MTSLLQSGSLSRALPLVGLVLVGLVAVVVVARAEERIATGRALCLELGPVDPRAPMVGDHMLLSHAVAQDAASAERRSSPALDDGGNLVLRVDERHVGTFDRFAQLDEEPAADEVLLRYRWADGRIVVGSEAWYFQEGEAELYAAAAYGCYRVDADGSAVLVEMGDENLNRIGEPRSRW